MNQTAAPILTADEQARWGQHLARCRTEPERAFLTAYLRRVTATPGAEVVVGETMRGADDAARGLLSERPELTRCDCILIHPDVATKPDFVLWRINREGVRSVFAPVWMEAREDPAWMADGTDEYLKNSEFKPG